MVSPDAPELDQRPDAGIESPVGPCGKIEVPLEYGEGISPDGDRRYPGGSVQRVDAAAALIDRELVLDLPQPREGGVEQFLAATSD